MDLPHSNPTDQPPTRTSSLLARWHRGDQKALHELLVQHLDWIRAYVRRTLGERLRQRAESADVVQEALMDALHYGPKFVVEDGARFRALLARIVRNNVADLHNHVYAERRSAAREESLHSGILDLDQSRLVDAPPVDQIEARENRAWVRLALELLDADDRRIILWREWDGRSFDEIGELLGTSANTARMRFRRSLPRLASKVMALREGRMGGALHEDSPPSASGRG